MHNAESVTDQAQPEDYFADVANFMIEVCEQPVRTMPGLPTGAEANLRIDLIREEVNELLNAIQEGNLTEIADGAADAVVVILGTCCTFGIDFRRVWREVHRTNMAKKGGERRPDGKKLKPPGWTPPAIAEILATQQPIH
jgi:predicted HAD superfamily Cof-like phosphohydrolase